MGFWMSRARDGRGWSVMTGFKLLITATLETPPPDPTRWSAWPQGCRGIKRHGDGDASATCLQQRNHLITQSPNHPCRSGCRDGVVEHQLCDGLRLNATVHPIALRCLVIHSVAPKP